MDAIYGALILGAVCLIGYFLHEHNSGHRHTFHNPFNYMMIINELKRDKSFYNVAPMKKPQFPYVLDQGTRYQIEGGFKEFQFIINLDKKDNLLQITATVSHEYNEDFGPEITWHPIDLTNSSYDYIGKYLALQLKEILDQSIGLMKEEYTLKIPRYS